MTIELPARVVITPDVMAQEVGGETVLLVLATGHYYGLDEVGTRMWQLLGEQEDTATVVARLLEEYEVDEATLQQDLARLIIQLAEAGLLTIPA